MKDNGGGAMCAALCMLSKEKCYGKACKAK